MAVNENGIEERARHFIKSVGLSGFEDYFPSELSGGMRQRCSIARALNYGSDFLLMDEPFTSLDYVIRQKMIYDLLEIHKNEKNTIIFVTHDIEEALKIGDRIFLLSKNPCTIQKIFEVSQIKNDDKKIAETKREILITIGDFCQ